MYYRYPYSYISYKHNKDKIINLAVINTGGTFNKEYNEIKGILEVRQDNYFIETILKKSHITKLPLYGVLYKDSLEITLSDRMELLAFIEKIEYNKILLVHGTDTMDESAKFLAQNLKNKTIVITGAMKPYSIDPVEATANFMQGIGFLQNCDDKKVYIAMHGMVKEYTKIKKNKKKGIFECLN